MTSRAFPDCRTISIPALCDDSTPDLLSLLLPGIDYYREKILPRVNTMSMQTFKRLNTVESRRVVPREAEEGDNIVEDISMGLIELS
jgi:hypothetical protein